MHKIPTQEEKDQMDLQAKAMLVNAKFQLSQTFLNTLLARPDVNVHESDPDQLAELSVDCAESLLLKLGILKPQEQE